MVSGLSDEMPVLVPVSSKLKLCHQVWRGVDVVSKQKCVICGKEKRFEQSYSFPGRLLALGYEHGDKAHVSCVEEKEDDLIENKGMAGSPAGSLTSDFLRKRC